MPYIKQEDRKILEASIKQVVLELLNSEEERHKWAGNLNYLITKVILDFYNKATDGNLRYNHYNEIIGMLECCKLEMYRRKVAAYEDEKIATEGDVE